MLFNSLSFLVFFPLSTAIYFALPHRLRWAFLLLASCLFYMAFVPVYILILFFTVFIDYVAGIIIERNEGWIRTAALTCSICGNVGILAVFKYFNFLNGNLHALADFLRWNYPVRNLGILLPIGLSFHTFQAMSYTIEVYRRRQRAEYHLGIYTLYVMFYPQLVAGPIERPQHLLHQFRRPVRFNADRAFDGLRRMLWGFFKKLVIADRMAPIADVVFNHPQAYGRGHLLLATYLFAVQIYCDFSGYTDIALGAAKVLGFRLMENFDRPYAATSIADFWRRWHISLSTWFRDYLYIPLGGSRVTWRRWCFNILVVFVISGLWHGASWTYAIWGLLHGTYLIVGRAFAPLRERIAGALGLVGTPLRRVLQMLITFHLVCFAWIFFRANTVGDAFVIVRRLLLGAAGHAKPAITHVPGDFGFALILIALLAVVDSARRHRPAIRWFDTRMPLLRWPAYYALLIVILVTGDLGAKSFIYFQF